MIKNITSNQILLIALSAVLLLMAAFTFYLLQDPSAPLPFAPPPASATSTALPIAMTVTPKPSDTPLPTRQTSYTPFATLLTPIITYSLEAPATYLNLTQTLTAGSVTASPSGTRSAAATTTRTPSMSGTPTTTSIATSPVITGTLQAGEYAVTGRLLQNGTPVANVVVAFEDDVAPRNASTNQSGHYWFTTLAPGTGFTLTFNQVDNPRLTPASEITSLAWMEGTLPIGNNTINLPDFEISTNLNGMVFDLQAPVDGATYSASVISTANPIQYIWTLYSLGGSYHIELGANGSSQPIFTSSQVTSTNFMWDGTLDDGTHITQGAYWWRVAVTKSLGSYVEHIFTQPWDILFNP